MGCKRRKEDSFEVLSENNKRGGGLELGLVDVKCMKVGY